MLEGISITSRDESPMIVNHIYITTKIIAILDPHSFEDQCNVLKYIIKYSSLY